MEGVWNRELIVNKRALRTLAVSLSVIFISLGAFVRIPLAFTPVPITLQTFFVLLSAAFLGRRLSAVAQSGYVLLGAAGLPVFTGVVGGLAYFISPTAGYLFGFILAGLFVAEFIKCAKNNLFAVLAVFLIGTIIILLCGVLWLKISLGIPLVKALTIGFVPFIPGDTLKAVAATLIYLKLKARIEEIL